VEEDGVGGSTSMVNSRRESEFADASKDAVVYLLWLWTRAELRRRGIKSVNA